MAVEQRTRRRPGVDAEHEHYKWWALSCTSLGMLLATINSGTLIIALPDLERALGTSILSLVWVILSYMISSTVLVLFAGRLSDLFGRKLEVTETGFADEIAAAASLVQGQAAEATPIVVVRGSSSSAHTAPSVSASRRIERNFTQVNTRPCSPTRCCT